MPAPRLTVVLACPFASRALDGRDLTLRQVGTALVDMDVRRQLGGKGAHLDIVEQFYMYARYDFTADIDYELFMLDTYQEVK